MKRQDNEFLEELTSLRREVYKRKHRVSYSETLGIIRLFMIIAATHKLVGITGDNRKQDNVGTHAKTDNYS